MTDETSEETDVIDSPLFPSSDSDIEHETELVTDTEPLTPLFADSLPVINDPDADIVDPSGLPPTTRAPTSPTSVFPTSNSCAPPKRAVPASTS